MPVKFRLFLLVTALALPGAAEAQSASPDAPAHASDLDAFMARVLARRDDNWKKMQQYVLEEDERLQITGPDGTRLFGFHRQYTWFIRDGYFIRSPLRVNGVAIAEEERRREEARWLRREQARERRPAGAARESDAPDPTDDKTGSPRRVGLDDVSGALEPRFVSAAYFLRFKFDPGHYALAGRERLHGRDVLKIEYYPSRLFTEGRTRPHRRVRERDQEIEEKLNKVSLVTLWIDPERHQILRYTFDNMGLEFLPARSIVRIDEMRASMEMTESFPGVWLPGDVEMRVRLTTALGPLDGRYEVSYHDYRLAEVTSRIRPPR